MKLVSVRVPALADTMRAVSMDSTVQAAADSFDLDLAHERVFRLNGLPVEGPRVGTILIRMVGIHECPTAIGQVAIHAKGRVSTFAIRVHPDTPSSGSSRISSNACSPVLHLLGYCLDCCRYHLRSTIHGAPFLTVAAHEGLLVVL